MTKAANPIPEGCHTITPCLCVNNAAQAIDFYKKAFNATEPGPRITNPTGRIGHTKLQIGDSRLMLADEHPEFGIISAETLGGSPILLTLYVNDADAAVQQAIDAGATLIRPVENQFYGDRAGQVQDPYGYRWAIHTNIEDVPHDVMIQRAQKLYQQT